MDMTYTRREMFAGLAASPLALAGTSYKPKLATQTVIWAQQFGQRKITTVDGLEEAFASTHKAGYHRVELMGTWVQGEALAKTQALSKKYKIACPICYNGGVMHEQGAAEKTIATTLEVATGLKSVGGEIISFNPSPKPKGALKTDDELALQARHINLLGKQLQSRGMKLFVHHHDPEMKEGAREWRHLLRNTDPKLMWVCMDTDWVMRGGQDVLGLLKECQGRLGSMHLRNSRDNVWLESLDSGQVDYPGVAAYLKQNGFTGYLVVELYYAKETKVTRTVEENLRLSRLYAEKTFGVKA
jgi:sugar phosphate isomerase/epimerase